MTLRFQSSDSFTVRSGPTRAVHVLFDSYGGDGPDKIIIFSFFPSNNVVLESSLFQPPEEKTWTYALPGTRDIVVNRALSKSYVAVLPPDEKEKVVQDIDEILRKGEGRKWTDESQGIFEYPYGTLVVILRKK
ncbi:hypothetical protein EVJ58_g3245 [Rhodofomes roseus]|uniref:Uncharacterized protein n=1 Tax=Rhodofomes roseus TaxID=34475 RepID=A0A4Y9YQZ6_9APHY|nr:hypothetical protein EVJ58_g3245 [Rhodofomes roseus]